MRDLVFHIHQQKWCQICFIIYPLFVLLPHNLRQLTFLTPPLPPPLPEQAATIIYHVSITQGVALPSLHPSASAVALVQRSHKGTSHLCHVGQHCWRRKKTPLPLAVGPAPRLPPPLYPPTLSLPPLTPHPSPPPQGTLCPCPHRF